MLDVEPSRHPLDVGRYKFPGNNTSETIKLSFVSTTKCRGAITDMCATECFVSSAEVALVGESTLQNMPASSGQ